MAEVGILVGFGYICDKTVAFGHLVVTPGGARRRAQRAINLEKERWECC
jgi:hypothetical protein